MNKKGFTLVELLAVISILAILAIITIISVNTIISDSENSLSTMQINNIEQAAKAYYLKEGMDNNTTCINVLQLVQKGYIEGETVKDPKTREEIEGSVKITYSSNKYYYKYQDGVCKSCTIERQISGKYSVGDLVTCGTEKFYVIENQDTDKTTGIDMLTMYNLDFENNEQSYNAGTIKFSSSSSYWYNNIEKYRVDKNYASDGRSYPYVYNSNSNIYPYVESYRNKLVSMGINVVDAKLISYEQLINLGCKANDCSSAKKWLYSTAYWTGSANSTQIWRVYKANNFTVAPPYNIGSYGIRPVITISVSSI